MNRPASELARLDVRDTAGVFAARQLGRGLAATLALERQDQIRVATALSEISRSAVTAGRTAVITFGIEDAELLLTVTMDGEPPADGIAAAARLMDQVTADDRVGRMAKRRPSGVHAAMVFRGYLFRALDGSSHRQRMFAHRLA